MRRLILFAAAALALAGCAKNEIDEIAGGPGAGYDPAKVVTFTTSGQAATRGTPVDDESEMTDMGVFCSYTGGVDWAAATDAPGKMYDRKLIRSGSGLWTYPDSSREMWETGVGTSANDRYTFFAYAPYQTADNGITVTSTVGTPGVPTLTYTVPTDVTKQPDLMVAVAADSRNIRPLASAVHLQMEHALTCVGFKVKGSGEVVTGIAVTGVSVSGDLAMDGGSVAWTNLGAKTAISFPASVSTHTTDGNLTDIMAVDGYLMMIPQALTGAKLLVTVQGEADPREIDLGAHHAAWTAGHRIDYAITVLPGGTITLDPTEITLAWLPDAKGSFEVICQNDQGIETPNLVWEFTVPAATTWFRLSTDPAATYATATTTVSGTGSTTIYVVAQENILTTAGRMAYVQMDGTDAVKVNQIKAITGSGTPLATNTYAGAFWKKNQTGERLITIPVGAGGAFSVFVLDYGDDFNVGDIVFSTDESTDTGITGTAATESPADMNLPANDTQYSVGGNAISATGTVGAVTANAIFFRIGLTSTWTPTASKPVRYAVIAVTHNGNTQKMYLRQGEDPDYLMAPGDDVATYPNRTTVYTRKFSPYNLTAPGMSDSDYTDMTEAYKGTFTEYPSQAGALFKWAGPAGYERTAWHPAKAAVSGFNSYYNGAWDPDIYETCPKGYNGRDYRRPTTAAVGVSTTSEIALSLLANPSNNNLNNSVWGYYADGYFDRRALQTANGVYATANNAVNKDSYKVAYAGRLFYNNVTGNSRLHSSIFFPGNGYRNDVGDFGSASNHDHYWTSTVSGAQDAFNFWTDKPNNVCNVAFSSKRDYGFAVRCVAVAD